MKNRQENLNTSFHTGFKCDASCLVICTKFAINLVSRFYEVNNFEPCLTNQLLNMFTLWSERGMVKTLAKTLIRLNTGLT